jgi:four helix bundle protein
MRRAAVSVPSNIEEGHGRSYKKETLQYLYITKSSLNEIETQAILIFEEKMMHEENYKNIEEKILQTRKLTIGFIQYLERNKGLN